MCLFQGFQCAWELKSQNPGFSAALFVSSALIITWNVLVRYNYTFLYNCIMPLIETKIKNIASSWDYMSLW